MLYKGVMITCASGKINGAIASRNRGGPYFKEWVNPIDPSTPRQDNCRAAMDLAVDNWRTNTNEFRQAWANYADEIRRTNRIGEKNRTTGFNEFCAWSIPRYACNLQLGSALGIGDAVARAPIRGLKAPPTGFVSPEDKTFHLLYDPDDFWVADQDNALLIYLSTRLVTPGVRVISDFPPTITSFKGPYQLCGLVDGDPDDPLPGEFIFELPDSPQVGNNVWWRVRLSTDDSSFTQAYTGSAPVA